MVGNGLTIRLISDLCRRRARRLRRIRRGHLVSSGECISCCKDFDINGQINSLEVVGRHIQAVGSMLLSADTVQVAMPSNSTLIKSEDDLQTCLMRVVAAAFVQCSFLFALGAAVSAFSDREVTPYLSMAVLCYGVCGGAALGRGMNREIKSEPAEAANLYSAALANYIVSYAAYLAYMVADAPTIR